MNNKISQEVKKIIAKQLGIPEKKVTLKKKFVDDLGADSLDLVQIVLDIEEKFKIGISDEDAETLLTVKKAIDYIQRRLAEREQEPPNYSI